MSGTLKHGHTAGGQSPEYKAWQNMQTRCRPSDARHRDYYDRGIDVHPDFLGPDGFEVFLQEVGMRPHPKHSLDRIDNDRGYEPGNLRWADRKTQIHNRRNTQTIKDQYEARIAELEELLFCAVLEIERRSE